MATNITEESFDCEFLIHAVLFASCNFIQSTSDIILQSEYIIRLLKEIIEQMHERVGMSTEELMTFFMNKDIEGALVNKLIGELAKILQININEFTCPMARFTIRISKIKTGYRVHCRKIDRYITSRF